MSQRVLLALTQAGLSREDAYKLVQRNAMKVWEEGKDFKTELVNDPEVSKVLTKDEIDEKEEPSSQSGNDASGPQTQSPVS